MVDSYVLLKISLDGHNFVYITKLKNKQNQNKTKKSKVNMPYETHFKDTCFLPLNLNFEY